jgi:hypothetical protein
MRGGVCRTTVAVVVGVAVFTTGVDVVVGFSAAVLGGAVDALVGFCVEVVVGWLAPEVEAATVVDG